MKLKITLLSIAFFAISNLQAQSVNIAGNPYSGNPYATITDAVSAANDGDVILITGIHTESIAITNKSITLRGSNPVTDKIQAAATEVQDGTGARVLLLQGGNRTITIENLGIRYGNRNLNGAGIFVDKISNLVTLSNLIIENNYTTRNGGGLGIDGSNVNVINCTIRNNIAVQNGGAIIAVPNNTSGINSIVNIQHSLIDSNTGNNGGAIFLTGNAGFGNDYKIDLTINNSTISNNSAISAASGVGGGVIWARSAIWTTTAGGDGTSNNVTLKLEHVTTYSNSHAAAAKAGLRFSTEGGVPGVNFSAYNSVIVNTDDVLIRSIDFTTVNTTEIMNCVLGGLNNANTTFLDTAGKNNTRGIAANVAGVTGLLVNDGGKTQILAMDKDGTFKNYCTETLPITLLNPTLDQRGFLRDVTPDAGAFEYYNIWNGSDNDFTNATNWSDGAPTAGGLVHIKTATQMPTASGAIDVANIVMNSGTSLIANSTYVGNLVYNRNLPTTNWYLIGSPVTGQNEDDFISMTNLDYGTGANRGFGAYNTLNDTWSYYAGTPSANTLTSGVGYSVKKMGAGDISFSGTMLTDNLSPISLTTTGNGFNLVSNPYPSFINSESMLDLTANSESLASKTIWVWDQSTGSYDAKIATESFKIAPTQAFFVKSNGAAGTLAINESFQSHEADTFSKSEGKTSITLQLTSGNQTKNARLYYVDGATNGFDNGYDGELFSGVANPFAIYSHLASLENNVHYQVQSVAKIGMENTIIPIGINAAAGKEITIEANISNLPEGLKVFLEDKQNKTFTELNESSKFTTTVNSNLDGSGRFYLHTKSSVLNIENNILKNVNIIKLDGNSIKIQGLTSSNAEGTLFNILGATLYNFKISTNSDTIIQLPNVSEGVYFVKLQTPEGSLSKKIILEN